MAISLMKSQLVNENIHRDRVSNLMNVTSFFLIEGSKNLVSSSLQSVFAIVLQKPSIRLLYCI